MQALKYALRGISTLAGYFLCLVIGSALGGLLGGVGHIFGLLVGR